MSQRPFSVCVYCGSRPGSQAVYADSAKRLGTELGRRGWRLVYGGGHVGLMGIVADAALAAGAPVLGVIPQRLQAREVGHRGLTELVVVDNMHQRKQRMAEEADAFIALPGGLGTFEELFEVLSWAQLGLLRRPCGILNVSGYFDFLPALLDRAIRQGLVGTAFRDYPVFIEDDPATVLDRLAESVATVRDAPLG